MTLVRRGVPRFLPTLAAVLVLLAAPPAAVAEEDRGELVLRTPAGRTLRVGREPRVALLVFGARWCRPCERLVPGLRRLAGTRGREDLAVVLVGLAEREDEDSFARWAREAGFEGTLVFDAGRRLERRFGVRELPALVAVGAGGRILWRGDRLPGEETVSRWLPASR